MCTKRIVAIACAWLALSYVVQAHSSADVIVTADPTVSEIQAFLELSSSVEGEVEVLQGPTELPLSSKLQLLHSGDEREGLASLSQTDRNIIHDEGLKFHAQLTEIGKTQNADICAEVSGRDERDVDFSVVDSIQQHATKKFEEMSQASYERMLARLSADGRQVTSDFVQNELGKLAAATQRGPMDLQVLESHRKAAVYLAQRKCADAATVAGTK